MSFRTYMSFLGRLIAAAVLLCHAGLPALAAEEPTTRIGEPEKKIPTVDVTVGQSKIIDVAFPAKRVSISNPAVADVDMNNPRRIQLQGKSVGSAEVTVWSEAGDAWQARIEVRADVSRMRDQLRRLFGNESLDVAQADDIAVISGTLARVDDAAQLRQLMQMLNIKYIDRTSVAGLQQVQLQVKVAEVSRTAVRNLGVDWALTDGKTAFAVNNGGSGTFTPTEPAGSLLRSLPLTTTIFGNAVAGSTVLEAFVKALADNQYLRILAEPTLVARSGQEASFLAGGQFPIPIANLGGGGTTQISIEYKDFGIQLHFTPIVLGNGKIQLKVAPEVSQLSDVGAVSVLGTRVPSILSDVVLTSLCVGRCAQARANPKGGNREDPSARARPRHHAATHRRGGARRDDARRHAAGVRRRAGQQAQHRVHHGRRHRLDAAEHLPSWVDGR